MLHRPGIEQTAIGFVGFEDNAFAVDQFHVGKRFEQYQSVPKAGHVGLNVVGDAHGRRENLALCEKHGPRKVACGVALVVATYVGIEFQRRHDGVLGGGVHQSGRWIECARIVSVGPYGRGRRVVIFEWWRRIVVRIGVAAPAAASSKQADQGSDKAQM